MKNKNNPKKKKKYMSLHELHTKIRLPSQKEKKKEKNMIAGSFFWSPVTITRYVANVTDKIIRAEQGRLFEYDIL